MSDNPDPTDGRLAELFTLAQRLQNAANVITSNCANMRSDAAKLRNLVTQIGAALTPQSSTETPEGTKQ